MFWNLSNICWWHSKCSLFTITVQNYCIFLLADFDMNTFFNYLKQFCAKPIFTFDNKIFLPKLRNTRLLRYFFHVCKIEIQILPVAFKIQKLVDLKREALPCNSVFCIFFSGDPRVSSLLVPTFPPWLGRRAVSQVWSPDCNNNQTFMVLLGSTLW